ncbi:Mitochondrial chaperone Frataxin [Mortierella sp. NVP85]|nr:Mitochondrial chaperone Frataxin [Mortierella sp. NVP85]
MASAATFNLARTCISRARPTQTTLRRLAYSTRPTAAQLAPVALSCCARVHVRWNETRATKASSAVPYSSSRSYSTNSKPEYSISDLTDDDYHEASDVGMDRMVEYFEDLGDEHEIPGYDVEYQSGVLTIKLGDKGTYVINKQPPNKQLWLSSPTTGPKRYDYDATHKTWFYSRDHHTLKSLLDSEISEAIGIQVEVPLDRIGDE